MQQATKNKLVLQRAIYIGDWIVMVVFETNTN